MVSYELELFHRYRYSLVKRALSPWPVARHPYLPSSIRVMVSSRFLLPSSVPLNLLCLSRFSPFPPSLSVSLCASLGPKSTTCKFDPAEFARTSQSSLFGKLRQRAERDGETAASVAVGFVKIDLEFRGRAAELGEFD